MSLYSFISTEYKSDESPLVIIVRSHKEQSKKKNYMIFVKSITPSMINL